MRVVSHQETRRALTPRGAIVALAGVLIVGHGCSSETDDGPVAATAPSTSISSPSGATTVAASEVASSSSSVRPTSSAPPSTTTSTSAPSTTTTSVAPPTDGLSWWPDTAAEAADPPHLYPTAGIPAHVHFVEFEFGTGPENALDYSQVWFDMERAGWLRITTRLGTLSATPAGQRIPLAVDGWTTTWTEAFRSPTGGGVSAIALQDEQSLGWVDVRGYRLAADTLEAVASTLRPAEDGSFGWSSPVLDDLDFFAEGGGSPTSYRSLIWSNGDNRAQAEVRVATNPAEDFTLAWQVGLQPEFITIDDQLAVLVEDGSRWSVTWVRDPSASVTAGIFASSRDEALDFFESIAPIEPAALAELVGPVPDTMRQGCQSMWC